MMSEKKPIQKEFPYQSKFVDVLGSKIHYIEEGEGATILFLHSMPASNYSWRNVIPHVAKHGRCIAPDLIGMGRSDSPDIPYRVFDHIRYIDGFIKALDLKDITLVLHGWGSIIGFDYAMRHEDNVRGIAFFESHIRPIEKWDQLALPVQEVMASFNSLPNESEKLFSSHVLMHHLINMGSMRTLSDEEMNRYFCAEGQALKFRPVIQYLKDYPHEHGAQDVQTLVADYSKKLQNSSLPMLMLYAVPGFNTTIDTIIWAREHLKNLTLNDLGEDLHLMQETQPDHLGQKITSWLANLFSKSSITS